MASQIRRVALLMHRWVGYLHGIQLGIAEYFLQRPEWVWTQFPPRDVNLAELARLGADGIIAFVEAPYVSQLHALGIPIVDISNWLPEAHFPRVLPDDVAIGHLGAQYLMDLGLKHFGFVGPNATLFFQLRQQGFAARLAAEGHTFSVCSRTDSLPPGTSAPPGVNPAVLAWLLALPKPAGILGANDVFASEVLAICHRVGLRVPEDLCVLGVDNDELLTKVSQPPLSSISLQTPKIGFEAARLLDRLMAGAKPPDQPLLLPPIGVVSRQSTNLLAIADEDVLAAVRYIREHGHQQLSVRDLLHVVPVNRRYLERKFKEHLGRTPLQEIHRVRLDKARELLANTDLSMPAIARRSGFPNPERLANVFRAELAMTPTEYRRKFRLQDF
jgi:LacI family transcriptional regulator